MDAGVKGKGKYFECRYCTDQHCSPPSLDSSYAVPLTGVMLKGLTLQKIAFDVCTGMLCFMSGVMCEISIYLNIFEGNPLFFNIWSALYRHNRNSDGTSRS